MKTVFPDFALKHLSTVVTIFVTFVYNFVLGINLVCSCTEHDYCNVYMCLPFFILFVSHLWIDKTFQRAWTHTSKFLWVLCYHTIRAAFIGLLWVVFVLVAGDWYVCCWNDGSEKQKHLACKDKTNLTPEEHTIIAELKGESLMIGLSVLLPALLVTALMSSFERMSCCENFKIYNRKILYHKLLLEEEENVLRETLRKAAKEELSEEIKKNFCGKRWDQHVDVIKELIEKKTAPTFPKEAQNQGQQQPDQQQDQQQDQQPDQQPDQQQDQQPDQQPDQQQPQGRRRHRSHETEGTESELQQLKTGEHLPLTGDQSSPDESYPEKTEL